MQTITNKPYTLILIEGTTFDTLEGDHFASELDARSAASMLTQAARQQAQAEARRFVGRYTAVRTLDSINRSTKPEELTVTDLRWLAGEVVDRCDFFQAAPQWARDAVESVADRRNFTPKYVSHVLAAIRCVLSVDRQMERQVEAHEASSAAKRRF